MINIYKIMRKIFFVIIFLAFVWLISINYFTNSIIYFPRVIQQIEKYGSPTDLGLTYTDEKIVFDNSGRFGAIQKFANPGFDNGWYIPAPCTLR